MSSRPCARPQVPCGGWELVASFAEEVAAIAEPLRLSDHKRDQRIAAAVRCGVMMWQGSGTD